MTYPPQPGQQPDPYGQQQPPSGGFAQPAWDPNQQQQQPYPTQQYPQGWDPAQQQQPAWDPNAQQYYGQPPSGGFAQPGWDPNAPQQYGQQPYGQPWDPNGGGQLAGWGAPPPPPQKSRTGVWIALVAVVVVLAAVGVTGFVAPGFFLSKSDNASGTGTVATSSVPAPSHVPSSLPGVPTAPSSGGGGNGEGAQVLKQFIDKLNAGDDAGAIAMGCPASQTLIQEWLKRYAKPPRQLVLGEVADIDVIVSADVSGKVGGEDVNGTVSAQNFDKKGYCIFTFIV